MFCQVKRRGLGAHNKNDPCYFILRLTVTFLARKFFYSNMEHLGNNHKKIFNKSPVGS